MTIFAIVESDAFDPLVRDEKFVLMPGINDEELATCIASALNEATGLDSDTWYSAVIMPYELKRAKRLT